MDLPYAALKPPAPPPQQTQTHKRTIQYRKYVNLSKHQTRLHRMGKNPSKHRSKVGFMPLPLPNVIFCNRENKVSKIFPERPFHSVTYSPIQGFLFKKRASTEDNNFVTTLTLTSEADHNQFLRVLFQRDGRSVLRHLDSSSQLESNFVSDVR